MVSVLRRNCYVPRAGFLASKRHPLPGAEPPPSPASMPSGCLATHLRLQWRDRTGIAPDFPFQPLRAPWVSHSCTTPPGTQPHVALTDHRVRVPVAFGQPTEQDPQRAPKQQLHLPGRDPEFPKQARGKGLRYFIDSWQKARKRHR